MDKGFVLLALAVVLISGCVTEEVERVSTTTTVPSLAARMRDTVYVSYTGRFTNGTIFDTSYEGVAKEAGIYDVLRDYKPLEFTIGEGRVIPGFEDAVIGMKVGEEKTVRIPPKEAYGGVDPGKVEQVNRTQTYPRIENVSRKEFIENIGRRPFIGMRYVSPPYIWNRTVLNFTDFVVTVRHDPGPDATAPTDFGTAEVSVDNESLYMRVSPKIGRAVRTPVGMGVVVNVTENMITVDFNHRLAGKTLIFDLKLENVTRGR
jgi:FKBP-type peptidyl-prolyl cis-trans isomerase 2